MGDLVVGVVGVLAVVLASLPTLASALVMIFTAPAPSLTSQAQPEPNTSTAALSNCFWNDSRPPKLSSAWLSALPGLLRCGDRQFQKKS